MQARGRGKIRKTTIVSFGLAAFLVGLAVSRQINLELWPKGIWLIFMTPLLLPRNKLSLLSIGVIGLVLGLVRGGAFYQELLPYRQFQKQQITILATASSDAVYGPKHQLDFDVNNAVIIEDQNSGKNLKKLPGTIGVRGFGLPMVRRGDRIMVTAKLYPSRGSRQARLSFAKLSLVRTDNSWLNNFRRRFNASLQSVLPEPLGSLAQGILIGQRSNLPEQLEKDMSVAGLTHIVAVSGYNLTILVQLAHGAAKNRSKYQAALLTIGLVIIFVAITGSSASIVRAAIVSMLSILAWYYGREFKPWVLILLAAVITSAYFPAYLWSDIGWHLSFLAFAGILLVAPGYSNRFSGGQKPKLVKAILIETLAAMVMTVPLIMFVFGRVSIVGLLANSMVVPLVPLAMLASFAAGLFGMILPGLAMWLAWPAKMILNFMVDIIGLLAGLNFAEAKIGLSLWQIILIYIIILVTVVIWWKRASQDDKIG